jgi:hypothetical protein
MSTLRENLHDCQGRAARRRRSSGTAIMFAPTRLVQDRNPTRAVRTFTREGEDPVWQLAGTHERIEAAGIDGLDRCAPVM